MKCKERDESPTVCVRRTQRPGVVQIGKDSGPHGPDCPEEDRTSLPWSNISIGSVPYPTAATLHALRYHLVDVLGVQKRLAGRHLDSSGRRRSVVV